MRKIIHISGQIPGNHTQESYRQAHEKLAEYVGGECVQFGTDGFAIVGDEEGEKRMANLREEKKEASKPINTPT
jgi:hypothetical protein